MIKKGEKNLPPPSSHVVTAGDDGISRERPVALRPLKRGGRGGARGGYRLVGAKHDCGADHGEGRADDEPEAARQVDEP